MKRQHKSAIQAEKKRKYITDFINFNLDMYTQGLWLLQCVRRSVTYTSCYIHVYTAIDIDVHVLPKNNCVVGFFM